MTIDEYFKDYPDTSLDGLKIKTPTGVVGYWKSGWSKGVWLSDGKSSRVYPQFVDSLKDCLQWEVASDEDKINCDIRTDFASIDHCTEGENRTEGIDGPQTIIEI